ncbi:hypothetical protein B0A48_18667 [Cryoendolithus antarcticus]|uniref:Uncharacterized protein n=1 Tax=Cryoendolithus antarcticus TaxID=1507870 RepID=A0A1V8S8M5_9PEZI|nr:hypothetical protein B0A48_18667 [Cryoendolithus antarcticus]
MLVPKPELALEEENRALVVQNNEKKLRKSTKATKVGTAKLMRYEDIVQAEAKADETVVKTTGRKSRKGKSFAQPPPRSLQKISYQVEFDDAERQIAASEYSEYCVTT